MKTTVVNIKNSIYDVYIGRGSLFGNPYRLGIDGGRDEVIEMYRDYILQKPEILAKLHELKGKRLGCFCYPKRCHGDILIEMMEMDTTFGGR